MTLTNFSLVIPTYHEAKNITELVHRIAQINFSDRQFEVLLVDDHSQDGTVELVEQLKTEFPWLRLIVRTTNKSLSESVKEGFAQAKYPLLISMDADLSHPPEKIPAMLNEIAKKDVDFAIGSRYVPGGKTDEAWPLTRLLASTAAASLARILLWTNVKDPLSGFFAIKREKYLSGAPLAPIGWKIGLEIMIKCHCKHIAEVPIHFSERKQGVSKINYRVARDYLRHVLRLMRYKFLQ